MRHSGLYKKVHAPLIDKGFALVENDESLTYYKVVNDVLLFSFGVADSKPKRVLMMPLFCRLDLSEGLDSIAYHDNNAKGIYSYLCKRYGMDEPYGLACRGFSDDFEPNDPEVQHLLAHEAEEVSKMLEIWIKCFEDMSNLDMFVEMSKKMFTRFSTIDRRFQCSSHLPQEILLSLLYMRRYSDAGKEIAKARKKDRNEYEHEMSSLDKLLVDLANYVDKGDKEDSRIRYCRYVIEHEAERRKEIDDRYGSGAARRLDFYSDLIKSKDEKVIDSVLQENFDESVKELIKLGVLPKDTLISLKPFAEGGSRI